MVIRRPLSLLCLAYILGIGFNYIFMPPEFIYLAGAAVFFVISSAAAVLKKLGTVTILSILLVIFNIGGFVCQKEMNRDDPMWDYKGSTVTFRGTGIKFQSKERDFHKLMVESETHNYLIHIYGEDVNPQKLIGSDVTFTGEVERPSPKRNPGGFDYALYLKSLNVRSIVNCEADSIVVTEPKLKENPLRFLYAKLAGIKYDFLKKAEKSMSYEAYGLLSGMIFGSKDHLSEDVFEAFQKNGIAHILSVSGIHVGIVYGFIYVVLGRRLNVFTAGLILFFLFVYAFLSEFSPSVIRAVLMISLHMVAKLYKRPYDILTAASFSAGLMLTVNPLTLFHVGFQLSFLATFLLAFGIPYLKRYVGKKRIVGMYKGRFKDVNGFVTGKDGRGKREKVLESLVPLVVIQFGMAPFLMFVFNYFSLSGLFMNIPVVMIAGIIIPVGVCLIPLSLGDMFFFGELVFSAGISFLDSALSLIIKINDMVFSLKFGYFTTVSPRPWILLLFYGLLFFFLSETFRILLNRKIRYRWVLFPVLIIITAVTGSYTQTLSRDNSQIVFLDVGQGDSIHVRTPSGKNILIDGGGSANYDVGKKVLLPYFLKNGIKELDYVFVTHLHTDHFKGIHELSNYMDLGKVITYDGNEERIDEIISESGIEKKDLVYVGKGDRFNIDEGVYMDVLHPVKAQSHHIARDEANSYEDDDENSGSLLLRLRYLGMSVLVTGDIDEEGEQLIMDELRDPDDTLNSAILKVGHHGSKYSTSDRFLESVGPKAAVIQVGKNNYGHPAPEIIEKLENEDIMLYRNDYHGAVMVNYENGSLEFHSMIDRSETNP